MEANDRDDFVMDRGANGGANDKSGSEFGIVAVGVPGADVDVVISEGKGGFDYGFSIFFEEECILVNVIDVVEGDISASRLWAPELGRNFDDKGVGAREREWGTRVAGEGEVVMPGEDWHDTVL